MNRKNLCIIPARGGSKRIPRKNIKSFMGKPIIVYSINAAIESGLFEEVMVSTDDPEIAEISQTFGASVPFMRSDENSNDFATTYDVVFEVINKFKNSGKSFDNICCIYPTAPFVSSSRLLQGYEMLNNGADSVMPILSFEYPIWRSFKINSRGCLEYNWSEYIQNRTQDLPVAYHDAGQWYWVKCNKLLESLSMISDTTKGLLLSPFEAHDIDTIDDWKVAEYKYEFFQITR